MSNRRAFCAEGAAEVDFKTGTAKAKAPDATGTVDISVIIPAYNAAKTIARCLDSVLQQQPRIEIIVIDDCSTDDTFETCREHQANFDNIRIVRNETNIGQGLSRNKGIELAKGEYLAFVDSDDVISRYMYEDLLSMARRGGYDLSGCQLKVVSKFMVSKADKVKRLEKAQWYRSNQIREILIPSIVGTQFKVDQERRLPWSPCTYLYSRDLVVGNNIVFESEREIYSEDFFFNIDILLHSNNVAFTESEYYFLTKIWARLWYWYLLRESCFDCKYHSLKRPGNITIGDYWGIEKVISEFKDDWGVSCLLVNDERGLALLDKAKDSFELRKTLVEEVANEEQPMLYKQPEKNGRKSFFLGGGSIARQGLKKLAKK